jgi:ubiquinone/menaquinone biosynthesis C-methylase UbiE
LRELAEKHYTDNGLYGTLDYGSPYPIKAIPHSAYIAGGLPKTAKLLVIGAGNGYEVVYLLKKRFKHTYSIDFYAPDIPYLKGRCIRSWAQSLPFKDKVFDMVICCETMEHIPEELTDAVLNETKRVASEVYFTIASVDDPPFYSHVNVKHPTWWMKKFADLGFILVNAQMNPWFAVPMGGGVVLFKYDNGVSLYAKC